MENKIQVFQNQEFGELRTVVKDGEPWFVAKDVCDALDIGNSRMATDRLDADEKDDVSLTDAIGREQATSIVSESGLYSLVLGSRKPQAHAFKRWVTHDVIPSIRKRGLYATPETAEKILGDPDFLIQALTELKQEREQRQKAEAKIEEDKPKVLFADSVGSSRQAILWKSQERCRT
jgi:anti-repressor protein